MKIKFVASAIAALTMAFVPTMAQAATTTLSVKFAGTSTVASNLVAGDELDVVVQGPIAKSGPATHELYSSWSKQSLGLQVASLADPAGNITWPEGWDLEYTTNGSTWVNWATTNPTNLSDIIAIRSRGAVNSVGENTFKTTSTGALRAASFSGSGGGDGYNVAIGNNKVFNLWHHQSGVDPYIPTVECHTFEGDVCATALLPAEGYATNHASSVYSDDASGKVYAFVQQLSSNDFGALCFNFSVEPAVLCGFTSLDSTGGDPSLEAPYQDFGSSSQDGNIIWSIAGFSGKLMCFNIATATACPDNGYDTTFTDYAFDTGRVTAVGGKVYFTLANKFGCYDPATDGLCGGHAALTLSDTTHRHPPLPVENTSGTVLGACDIWTERCVSPTGTEFSMPTTIHNFIAANADLSGLANQNASQFAYVDNRFYYITQATKSGAIYSSENWTFYGVDCYDFQTEAACAGFDGTNRDGIERIYTVSADTQIPNCVWANGDNGSIVPLNATTGEVGCDLGNPVIELPYDAVTPRMSCSDEGRVVEWGSLVANIPAGAVMSDVRVGFYDSEGAPVSGWTNRTVDSTGFLDLTGLTVNDTGTTPTIRISAGDISDELAGQISGTVTFVAEDPQLCFTLEADNHCETTISNSPAPGSIADGIIEGTSITRPNSGLDVGSKETANLTGSHSSDMCAASALRIELPPTALASTGFDPSGFGLAGFAILAAGVGAVAAGRRRKV